MSDSVTKWHEMQEDKKASSAQEQSDREKSEIKKKAYRLLCEEDERVIRMAMKILNIGE
jgi:hypothetical protein